MVIPYQVLYASLVLILFLFIFFLSTYNGYIKMIYRIQEAFSNIEVLLMRRISLIENLVNIVKDYARHEESTYVNIAKARALVQHDKTVEGSQEVSDLLGSTMKSLYAVVENYPDLKANANYIKLMDQLTFTENKIAEYRERYNKFVQIYNQRLHVFPNIVSAVLFGFVPAIFYDKDNE